MKTKVVLMALLSFLLTNANADQHTFKGGVDVKYASDHHRRGEIVSQDALQTTVGVTMGVAGVDVFGDVFSSESLETGSDVLEGTIGTRVNLSDRLDLYAGLYNSNIGTTGTTLEGFVSVKLDVLLQPTVVVYRDVSDDLYTYELQASHGFDLGAYDLGVTAFVGTTDATASDNVTYYATSLTASKSLRDNLDIFTNVAYSDTDDRDEEFLWGAGLSVKF